MENQRLSFCVNAAMPLHLNAKTGRAKSIVVVLFLRMLDYDMLYYPRCKNRKSSRNQKPMPTLDKTGKSRAHRKNCEKIGRLLYVRACVRARNGKSSI